MTECSLHPVLSRPLQARFLTIPQALLRLRETSFGLLYRLALEISLLDLRPRFQALPNWPEEKDALLREAIRSLKQDAATKEVAV
jgi:hypothetical protein